MAGGIFKGQPFVLNIKCIIFSLICMALLMFDPKIIPKGVWTYFTLFLVFVVSYVALAWYDYFYDCELMPLKRGTVSITGKLKPDTEEREWSKEEDTLEHKLIYVAHILFICPFLLYFYMKRGKVSSGSYSLLVALTVFTLAYHGGKLMVSSH